MSAFFETLPVGKASPVIPKADKILKLLGGPEWPILRSTQGELGETPNGM